MKVICVLLLSAVALASASPALNGLSKILYERLNAEAAEIQPFIVGGETAGVRSAPYLVSLSVSAVTYAHNCAGAIIGKEWVLTAAHCVNELKKAANDVVGLPVYAGLTDRDNAAAAQVRTIDFAFNHKQFTGVEGSDDIALLHVTPAFEINAAVRPISLPYRNEQFAGEVSANYGWGLNDTASTLYVKDLQVAKSNVLSLDECKNNLPGDAPLNAKNICVKVTACYGDGGSPLVIERDAGVAELVGITSWGYLPCGYNNRPTVYTAVSEYVDWIAEVQYAYYVLH